MNQNFANHFKKGFKSFWKIGLILGCVLVIIFVVGLKHFGCYHYPDEIQYNGKQLHRYITLITTSSSSLDSRISRDTMSYYADSTGMPYRIVSSCGGDNIYDSRNGDTLFYKKKGELYYQKKPVIIHNGLVRCLTENDDMLGLGDWNVYYDKNNQLQRFLLDGDGDVAVKCARGFRKNDNYYFEWKEGLLTEIYFNGKLRHRITYNVNKRGENAGLPAFYMAGLEQITRANNGLLYLLAGYLGRIPNAEVDRIDTYNKGKLLFSRKVSSKFDRKDRLSEYSMQEFIKVHERIDTLTNTLRLIY